MIEKDINGGKEISQEHVDNNPAVRKMLGERGVKPEQLSPAEDVKKIQRKLDVGTKQVMKDAKRPAKK